MAPLCTFVFPVIILYILFFWMEVVLCMLRFARFDSY